MNERVPIENEDVWVKVVDMLQQNWAVIEPETAGRVRVYFISDASVVFDEIAFPSAEDAAIALQRNGFRRYAASKDLQAFSPASSA
jgi:hypothetical protein